MPEIAVKICGITNLEDALAACEAGADALGFVFAPEAKKRNRYIDPAEACNIINQLPPYVTTVGVVVNEPVGHLNEYLDFVDRLQLHGEESPEICACVGPKAMKAFRVGPHFDCATMADHPSLAFLLDAFVPGEHGGTGALADWDTARVVVQLGKPVILAGGLTPDNVAEAVQQVRPYGVDTSGGVEASPGKKDHERIRSFIHNAKSSLAR